MILRYPTQYLSLNRGRDGERRGTLFFWECILKLYSRGDAKSIKYGMELKKLLCSLALSDVVLQGHAARLFKGGLCGQITSAWPTWNLLTHKIYSRVKAVAKPPLAMPMFHCCFLLLPLLYFRKFWLFTFLSSPAAWMLFERFPR